MRFVRACARSQDLRKKTHNGSRHALSSAHAPAVLDKRCKALGEQALQHGIILRACVQRALRDQVPTDLRQRAITPDRVENDAEQASHDADKRAYGARPLARGGTSDQGHAGRGGCTYSANTMNGICGTNMRATEAYITDVDMNTVVVA